MSIPLTKFDSSYGGMTSKAPSSVRRRLQGLPRVPSCGAPLPGAHLLPSPSSPVRRRVLPPWSLPEVLPGQVLREGLPTSLHLQHRRECKFLPATIMSLEQCRIAGDSEVPASQAAAGRDSLNRLHTLGAPIKRDRTSVPQSAYLSLL